MQYAIKHGPLNRAPFSDGRIVVFELALFRSHCVCHRGNAGNVAVDFQHRQQPASCHTSIYIRTMKKSGVTCLMHE